MVNKPIIFPFHGGLDLFVSTMLLQLELHFIIKSSHGKKYWGERERDSKSLRRVCSGTMIQCLDDNMP